MFTERDPSLDDGHYIGPTGNQFEKIIGAGRGMSGVLDQVRMVAATDCTVLIQGETGTGKELIAEAIHQHSPRRSRPCVTLNCAAIPAGLLESELFGHERGAFTGAVAQTVGRFQAADRGTLFLDEIGDLPLDLQPKLLRALQEKQVERLGGGRTLKVDVRVIAATNQDLWSMVQERRFRADLYYRLNVFPIKLPPLRERADDIELLVEHFVQKFAKQQGKVIESIADGLLDTLKRYDWPGNIRELQNVMERAVIITTGSGLSPKTTELLRREVASTSGKTLADAERAHIAAALRKADWVIGGRNGAAAQLGLPRTTLIARMERLGIVRERSAPRRVQLDRRIPIPLNGHSHSPDEADGNTVRQMAAVLGRS